MEHIKHVKHGESKTRLYRIWSNLKNRVLPNSVKSKYYFDRGIGLCDEWKNSFISFRDWSINNGYDDKLTLDRIDNDGSYTPENCRWVDMKTQANNRSNNITVYADKECVPFSDVCRILGVDYNTAYGKIIKHLVANKNVERTVKNRKEPVSEDLEMAAEQDVCEVVNCCSATGIPNDHIPSWVQDAMVNEFIHGAKWQKNHLWKPANGDDLPEYDREVIAILDYDFGHYKVVYAHRPNPNGWNGTNIDTGKKEHFEPVIYDKGGWNQPHILYWLDARLPYEENKITKQE